MSKEQIKSVAIGADHGAFEAKEILKSYLQVVGYKIIDVGTDNNTTAVDYPDFAYKLARKVVSGECERGIMLDGAGIGSSMVCNKVNGIRAALCWSSKTIINSAAITGLYQDIKITRKIVPQLKTPGIISSIPFGFIAIPISLANIWG